MYIYTHTHICIYTCTRWQCSSATIIRCSRQRSSSWLAFSIPMCGGKEVCCVWERERERERRRGGMPVSGFYYRIINTCSMQIQNKHNQRERERERRRSGMPISGIDYRIIDTCNRQLQNKYNLVVFFPKSVPLVYLLWRGTKRRTLFSLCPSKMCFPNVWGNQMRARARSASICLGKETKFHKSEP